MLVIAQHWLEFGPTHHPAMDKRLRTYCFKSLKNHKKKAAAWLRNHAMDCVFWAAEKAKCCEDDTTDSDEECIMEDEEGILMEKEKEAIRSLSLSNSPMEETTAADSDEKSSMEDTREEAITANDVLIVLRESLKRSHSDSHRYPQVKHMIWAEERKLTQQRNFAKRQQEARKGALRGKGVCTQSADLLPTNPDSATTSPIQRELQRYYDDQKACKEQERREKSREVFEGTWIRATEAELKSCCDTFQTSRDPSTRSNMKAGMNVLLDKLKAHHQSIGTFNTAEAVQERIRVCTSLGLLREEDHQLVTSVAERLPVTSLPGSETKNVPQHRRQDETEKEDSIFITPRPRTSVGSLPHSTADCAVSDALLQANSNKKRLRISSSQRVAKKTQNTLSWYFTSQT